MMTRHTMCASRTLCLALLAMAVATSPGAAQGRGQAPAQTQAPRPAPKYPVRPPPATPEAPPSTAPEPEPAKAPPAASPTAPAPAGSTRYPVKPAAPAAAVPAAATTAPAASPAAAVEAAPRLDSFRAQGLINEPSLTAIYRGDFAQSTITHDGALLPAVLQGYLTAFAQRCSASLPPNKVEMLSQQCATESVTRNGFGVEISRVCVEWVDVRTGLYADPELYAAKNQLERVQAADAFRSAMQLLTTGNPIGTAMQMVAQVKGARDDMARVVEANACGGPGLKRFGENLRRFTLNLAPLKLEGQPATSPATLPVRTTVAAGDQDYARLIDDLIADQSRTWLVNKYQRGSVRAVNVVSRDAQGQPARIEASYSFVGFERATAGSLVLTFVDGAPNCIYFFDSPACRSPARDIVAGYLGGKYRALESSTRHAGL